MKTLEQLIKEYNSMPYGVTLEKFIYDYLVIHAVAAERERIKEIIVKNYVGIHPVLFNKIIELIDSL